MRKSELRRIIRTEIRRITEAKEDYDNPVDDAADMIKSGIEVVEILKLLPKRWGSQYKGSQKEVEKMIMDAIGIKKLSGWRLTDLANDASWVLEASMKNATIGEEDGEVAFYGGIWLDGDFQYGIFDGGTFRGGTFKEGTWISGNWKGGNWISGYDEDGEEHGKGDSPNKW